jgi:MYXO-CTERM domain-containing protein
VRAFLLAIFTCALASTGWAAPILNAAYPDFSLVALGSLQGVPASYLYAGLGFNGSSLLLSGGDPTAASPPGFQAIYSIQADRDVNGMITGFTGTASQYASVQVTTVTFNNQLVAGNLMAGGLVYAPDGTLLYTTASQSYIGQYSPSASTSSLTSVGSTPLGSIGYLPNGQLVLTSTNGTWYSVTLGNPDANGIYQNVTVGAALNNVNAPADSFANVPGGLAQEVPNTSVLVGDTNSQALYLYGLDGNGNPTGVGSQVVNGNGEAVGYGLVRDPLHPNSYLFTTGNNDIWMLTEATPEPSGVLLALGGLAVLAAWRRKCVGLTASRDR